ncbi:MAG: adenosine deaminase [Gemmatimonadota bacterium]
MTVVTSDLLRRLPKTELHCHLDGCVRASTLLELAAEYDKPMPADDAEALAQYMLVDDAENLEDYLERFSVTLSVMQTGEALERIAYELAEDAAREGVRYLETRYAPVLNVRGGLSLEEAVEAPLRGLARAHQEYGIVGRVIVCAIRNMAPEVSLELARLAVAFKGRGVAGFDLAGGEVGNPASRHKEAFDFARENDLPCTCHAGEGAGAESVRDAVHRCCVCRIGHGTRLLEDASLTEYVNDRRITIECCITSNVQTRAAQSFDTHPLRQFYDRGLNVVLSTDNRLMSGITLVDEYQRAATHLGFTFEELCAVARNGFTSAFLHENERSAMLATVDRDIAALLAEGRS